MKNQLGGGATGYLRSGSLSESSTGMFANSRSTTVLIHSSTNWRFAGFARFGAIIVRLPSPISVIVASISPASGFGFRTFLGVVSTRLSSLRSTSSLSSSPPPSSPDSSSIIPPYGIASQALIVLQRHIVMLQGGHARSQPARRRGGHSC